MSASSQNIKGYINSIQSLGAVDGPGVRFVVFLQGCPLRCIYCHNPETWDINLGLNKQVKLGKSVQVFTPEQLLKKALRYKSYFGSKGGITLSGGEV
ncbi:MAG: 4Fe-4S cluster-binding domain-containing protein, partial [Proteocatella sp.]